MTMTTQRAEKTLSRKIALRARGSFHADLATTTITETKTTQSVRKDTPHAGAEKNRAL